MLTKCLLHASGTKVKGMQGSDADRLQEVGAHGRLAPFDGVCEALHQLLALGSVI
jgi:hypothetical protein